jgi:UDP-N-acetylmuramoylalanine--D-glutamate ligase
MSSPRLDALGRTDSWEGVSAVVAGLGVSGFAAADTLLQLGASVTVVEDGHGEALTEKATLLEVLGADVRLGPSASGGNRTLPPDTQVVVTSPSWRPSDPMLASALAAGVPVWGEVELAWRLRGDTPWLCLTGTNGKTTTVQMLASILTIAGLRTAAVGNVGMPVTEAVMDPRPYDVLAVELSSFQLHWTSTMSARASAVLNVAPDHLDWYAGSARSPEEAYAADKARIYARSQVACIYNVEDPATEQMVVEAEVVEGARAVGFTLGVPAVGMLGLVDDVLADRAFVAERRTSAAELATLADISPPAPHNVANALAAAALARAYGVQPVAVRDGLRAFRPDAHRIALVVSRAGVDWVDDSKATNPHAALASLRSYDSVVWLAGGLAKGADFDELVRLSADRLRTVVLLGADRHLVAQALQRHAPDVPVVDVGGGDTGQSGDQVMERAVFAAGAAAQPGDTVLLAPGCASQDLFDGYAARGNSFAAAVHRQDGDSGDTAGRPDSG